MQEQEYNITGGSLYYEVHRAAVAITRLQGMQSQVTLPATIDQLPVTTVERKAFLSKKSLQKIVLPESLTELGDWAFAYCTHLQEVELPDQPIQFGKAVFLDCPALEKLTIRGKGADVAALLAAAAKQQVGYLLDVTEAGHPEWLKRWDLWLSSILHLPDTEGYSKQVLCGEEDYGSTDLNAYVQNRRKEKVRLILLRLSHPTGLSEALREELETYLTDHTKGCDSEESWLVIREECGEQPDRYQLFARCGCVTADNIEGILADIGEADPEMKAYFLRYQEEELGYGDFFGGLEL